MRSLHNLDSNHLHHPVRFTHYKVFAAGFFYAVSASNRLSARCNSSDHAFHLRLRIPIGKKHRLSYGDPFSRFHHNGHKRKMLPRLCAIHAFQQQKPLVEFAHPAVFAGVIHIRKQQDRFPGQQRFYAFAQRKHGLRAVPIYGNGAKGAHHLGGKESACPGSYPGNGSGQLAAFQKRVVIRMREARLFLAKRRKHPWTNEASQIQKGVRRTRIVPVTA